MFFSAIRLRNFRSFGDSDTQPLGPITLIVGRNNSGKSAFLHSVYAFQDGVTLRGTETRIGTEEATVELVLSDGDIPLKNGAGSPIGSTMAGGILSYKIKGNGIGDHSLKPPNGPAVAVARPGSQEPGHLIHPIFSGRFSGSYEQASDMNSARQVWPNDQNIISRVKQIANADFPESVKFRALCQQVLGVTFEVLDTEGGGGQQRLGVSIDRHTKITLESMGTGLLTTLNLIVTLSTADRKIILVEEPENDLHPAALKVSIQGFG